MEYLIAALLILLAWVVFKSLIAVLVALAIVAVALFIVNQLRVRSRRSL